MKLVGWVPLGHQEARLRPRIYVTLGTRTDASAGGCASERRIAVTTNTTTHPRRTFVACAILATLTILSSMPPALAATGALVSVGSPTGLHPRNAQNEPALAVDANHPNILAAGSNDLVDM